MTERAAPSVDGLVIGILGGTGDQGSGVYAGRLRNCGQVEALTANLVAINRRYKAHAGLRITDI
jgi:8-hydroxy-5-deazaflavin:NADPH oxidoreductase